MARIAKRSTTPIATGERLIAAYSCRELVELGVVISFRPISITWVESPRFGRRQRWPKLPGSRWRRMPAGPIGGLATLHVDAAMPNFSSRNLQRIEPGMKEKVWEEWSASRDADGHERFPLPDKPGLGFRYPKTL